jgi:membrane-associated phospholipid phosphatase
MSLRQSLLSFLFLIFALQLHAQNEDIFLLRKINVGRNEKLDGIMKAFSFSAFVICPTAPLVNSGVGLYNNDKTLTRQGLVAGSSLILAMGISTGLKFVVKRKRPFVQYEDIQQATQVGPYSFPSGHTTTAFAMATAFSLAYPKWYVIAPAYVWAGTIAYSRMHLGVHFPSDVLTGILIGVGSSLLCYQAQHWVK